MDAVPGRLCLGRSSSTTVDVHVVRASGFTGPVTIGADAMVGLTIDAVTIAATSDRASVTLRTTNDAPAGPTTLKLHAGDAVATLVVEIGDAEAGTRDTSFGVNGTVTVPLAFEARLVALAPQGDSFVVSATDDGGSASHSKVVRVRPNGALDDGFGDPATHSIEGTFSAFALGVRTDGRLLVGTPRSDGSIYREYGANGSGTGVLGEGALCCYAYPLAMREMSNGALMVAGFFYGDAGPSAYVQRNQSDGALDTTFPSKPEYGNPTPTSAVRADGASVMATSEGVVGFKSDGSLAFHLDKSLAFTAVEWASKSSIVAAGKTIAVLDDAGKELSTFEGAKLPSTALWVAPRRDGSVVAVTSDGLMTVTPQGSTSGRALAPLPDASRRRLALDTCGRAVTAESAPSPDRQVLLRRYWP